jgi:hypothetical protein
MIFELCFATSWQFAACFSEKLLCLAGFEIVPAPFRDAYPFGGALHCATTDVYREGTCEDYFPKQVEAF